MSLATNLKELREKKGLGQRELGDEVGLTRNQVNAYERDQAKPSIEMCVKLAEYFGVTIKQLAGID